MANLNKVQLIGNLTRDPELRSTRGGTHLCDFGLAINRRWKDDHGETHEETTFVDVTFWGRIAEAITKWTKKGHSLYVEGRLQLDTWEDKQTGQQRSRLRVIGEQVQFLEWGRKKKDGEKERGGEGERPEPPTEDGPPDDLQDDIPF
jgi:single-strand DNA-binding protein